MAEEEDEKKLPFHEMGLDDRILKAIAKLGWIEPTLIQERGIPLILEGKDLLARGRTGSGKTGAFAVPLVQVLYFLIYLKFKTTSSMNRTLLSFILDMLGRNAEGYYCKGPISSSHF